jgi:hypothetical protein
MMTFLLRLLVATAAVAAALPAGAASSAVASASDSVSTSVESVSGSFRRSSHSSARTVVGQGDYEVIQMARADEPGRHDVTLRAVPGTGAEGEFTLRMPDKATVDGGLAVGRVVSARERPYGVEFARADTRAAFFLLLEDDWYRDLQTVPL